MPMTKNLMTIFCILAIFSFQSIVCEQIHRSSHLQTDISNSQNVGFGDNNRLLSIVNIAQNEESTSTGQAQIQNPFIGGANAQDSNEKGYSSLKKYTKKNFYQYQVSTNSGYLLNSQSNHYVDSNGNQINNLMLITGMCGGSYYNPNGNYYLQFNPDSFLLGAFSIPLEDGIMDGFGLYQSWVPLGDFIFPFIPYQMVVNGWCGIDNIGPKLNSTSTGYTIQ